MEKLAKFNLFKKIFIVNLAIILSQICLPVSHVNAYNNEVESCLGDFVITTETPDLCFYNEANKTLILFDGAMVIFENLSPIVPKEGSIISIADNAHVSIAFNSVTIDVSEIPGACAFKIGKNSTVSLNLYDENRFYSGYNQAGIEVGENSCLIFNAGSPGASLKARGNAAGAGIGASFNKNSGSIHIHSGYIKAFGGEQGPGIGQFNRRFFGGEVIINGGTVKAEGGGSCAGISGSILPKPDKKRAFIHIKSGTVTAKGGPAGGPGICVSDTSPLVLSEGVLKAYGTGTSSGIDSIGDAENPKLGIVSIKGGTLRAFGGTFGGFGIGSKDAPCKVKIEGGSVLAIGGTNAHGIYIVYPGEIIFSGGHTNTTGITTIGASGEENPCMVTITNGAVVDMPCT
jgi:hypothetical protein